jgi:hypothetical protein
MNDFIIYNEMFDAYHTEYRLVQEGLLSDAMGTGNDESRLTKILKFIPRLIRAIVVMIRRVIHGKRLQHAMNIIKKANGEVSFNEGYYDSPLRRSDDNPFGDGTVLMQKDKPRPASTPSYTRSRGSNLGLKMIPFKNASVMHQQFNYSTELLRAIMNTRSMLDTPRFTIDEKIIKYCTTRRDGADDRMMISEIQKFIPKTAENWDTISRILSGVIKDFERKNEAGEIHLSNTNVEKVFNWYKDCEKFVTACLPVFEAGAIAAAEALKTYLTENNITVGESAFQEYLI